MRGVFYYEEVSSSESHLITLPVRRFSHFYPQVRALLTEAFPPAELVPEWVLNAFALRRSIDFLAYFDPAQESSFCGITFTVHSEDLLFVIFLATDRSARSKGYGSRILSQLKDRYPTHAIALEIEPMLRDAENFHQRERRLAFYQRNGFEETGLFTNYEGKDFEVLLYVPKQLPTDRATAERYKDLHVLCGGLQKLLSSLTMPVFIPIIHVGMRE